MNEEGASVKSCRICAEAKPLDAYPSHSAYPDGRDKRCRACRKAYDRQRYEQHRDRIIQSAGAYKTSDRGRDRLLRREYGISLAEWQALYQRQAGACAICEEIVDPTGRNGAHLDHCHNTGVVRGILCAACNKGLGQFRDDPRFLVRAAEYVTRAAIHAA